MLTRINLSITNEVGIETASEQWENRFAVIESRLKVKVDPLWL